MKGRVQVRVDTDLVEALTSYAADVSRALMASDFPALADVAAALIEAKAKGRTIFTAGNGGSMATASHMVNDLTKGCRVYGREGFRAICLADSGALVTCLANDFSYDDAFAIALKSLARKGDVLVVFSGSGNSPSVVRAAEQARAASLTVIGFLGRDGGALRGLCDISVIALTDNMEQIEDMHLMYEHALVSVVRERLAEAWGIEIVDYPENGRVFKSAIFDFDGTVSLIREGWQEVMLSYFLEVLGDTPCGKTECSDTLSATVREAVAVLTGKQTIFQCIMLDDAVAARGGERRDPLLYKQEYLRRLMLRIQGRREGLRDGTIDASQMLVPGIKGFLSALKAEGVSLYLASGTDDADVQAEAALLGIDAFFDGQIYGALDEHATDCTKELVIKRIFAENDISGSELLSFGDGYVEIELVHGIGGYAVAVATDEAARKGVDEWKRARLLRAGASAVIPDFANTSALMTFLKGEW